MPSLLTSQPSRLRLCSGAQLRITNLSGRLQAYKPIPYLQALRTGRQGGLRGTRFIYCQTQNVPSDRSSDPILQKEAFHKIGSLGDYSKSIKTANEAPPISRKMHDMTDQVVLITGIGSIGAGWGNGRAIATLFARQGAKIVGCDLSLEAAEISRTQILAENSKTDIMVMHGDATSSSSMKAFVDACIALHGRVDILINNVGRTEPGDPASMTEDVWDSQMDVNLKSVYLTTHLVLPIMAAQPTGGSIVNISSVSGLRYIGKPQVAYSAAKAAILSFTRTTAVIYADKGVRLNTVVPGLINTPLVKVLADKHAGGDYENYCRVRDQQCPTGKQGSSWDIANAVLFLASKEAGYITGTEIVVDGGLTQSTGRA